MANLNLFDLNLLVALDALLSERSVTRAAERLCVTQPAMSGTLLRLRAHYDDPLLARVGRQMELTPKARALIEPVRKALLQVENAVEARAIFDPTTTERTFRIAMSDYCVHVFLPAIIRKISKEAPAIRLIVENVFGPSFTHLSGGEIDMVITHGDRSLFGRQGEDVELVNLDLFEDSFVCLVSKDHPIDGKLTMADYLKYPHAVAHFGNHTRTVEEAAVERKGIIIRDQLLIPGFAGLIFQLEGTEMIATVQRKLGNMLLKYANVKILEPPVSLPILKETLIWHNRNENDPGHCWLRELFVSVAKTID